MIEDVFPIENGNISASYVSVVEGTVGVEALGMLFKPSASFTDLIDAHAFFCASPG